MIRTLILASGAALVFAAPAFADGHGGENAERHAACVANITEISAAAGKPVNDADEVCKCMGRSIMENPTLVAEIDAAGGLPSEEEASAELKAVVEPCLAADAG